jgi:hypothetical protein
MAFKFNPFTGTLDQTGSGGGASYIDGEVQNFSALPETIGTPAVDSAYLVREAEGTWLLARKPAGIYIRTADTGVRAADWTHASAFPDVFSDAAFTVYSDGDSTKNLQLSLSGLTTGTTRTLTAPDASGTIARTEDFAAPPQIGSTTPNTGAFTTLTANNGTLTASAPVLDLAQTWNNSGTTFTGLLANFTNTASGSASKALDIKIGGTSVIETNGIGKTTVRLLGAATFNLSAFEVFREGSLLFRVRDDGQTISSKFIIGTSVFMNSSGIKYGSSQVLAWGSGTANDTSDLVLLRDAADTLAQRRTTNPQTFRIYNTFTDATNFERLNLRWASNVAIIGTEKGSVGGSARALELQTDGTTRLTVGTTGNVGIGTTSPTEKLTVFNDTKSVITSQFASNQCLVFGGDTVVGPYTASHTDGNGNSFGNFVGVRQRFGAAGFIIDTSPATSVGVARSWTERLRVEPANGNVGIGTTSPTAKLHVVGTVLVGGTLTFSDANNIAVGTTTGTKIGTATTQKLGFFNATPVVQQAAVADATDAATAITQLNDLLAAMRTLGLIAT